MVDITTNIPVYRDSSAFPRDSSKSKFTVLQEKSSNATLSYKKSLAVVEANEKIFDYPRLPHVKEALVPQNVNGHISAKASLTSILDDSQSPRVESVSNVTPEESRTITFSRDTTEAVAVGTSSRKILGSVRDYLRESQLRTSGQFPAQNTLNVSNSGHG